MATPTLVTVSGTFNPPTQAQQVLFKIPTILRYTLGPDTIVPTTLTANVNQTTGAFSLQVYGTNDPLWLPLDWLYRIEVRGKDLYQAYNSAVPYNAGSMDFPDILPIPGPPAGRLYSPIGHGAHVLVLATGAPVPGGTPAGTVIVRT